MSTKALQLGGMSSGLDHGGRGPFPEFGSVLGKFPKVDLSALLQAELVPWTNASDGAPWRLSPTHRPGFPEISGTVSCVWTHLFWVSVGIFGPKTALSNQKQTATPPKLDVTSQV